MVYLECLQPLLKYSTCSKCENKDDLEAGCGGTIRPFFRYCNGYEPPLREDLNQYEIFEIIDVLEEFIKKYDLKIKNFLRIKNDMLSVKETSGMFTKRQAALSNCTYLFVKIENYLRSSFKKKEIVKSVVFYIKKKFL